jgi:hypothetical protein
MCREVGAKDGHRMLRRGNEGWIWRVLALVYWTERAQHTPQLGIDAAIPNFTAGRIVWSCQIFNAIPSYEHVLVVSDRIIECSHVAVKSHEGCCLMHPWELPAALSVLLHPSKRDVSLS